MNNWIVCLKHGTKYSSEYVNKLYNMTQRHCSVAHSFACITEDATNLNSNIHVIPITNPNLNGWWYKPWVFSKDFPISGTFLFMDLDIVIINNIDKLWEYEPNRFCIIRDFNRKNIQNYNRFNSSIFRLVKGTHNHVWDNLAKDYKQTKLMHGDQDWIYKQVQHDFIFWPDEWIQSYKWEIRNRTEVILDKDFKRRFKNIANPIIQPNTSILVFHGDPKPDDVADPIIIDNWK